MRQRHGSHTEGQEGRFISYGNRQVQLSEFIGPLVVMYGCDSWTIKKTEHRRINAFKLCYWRRLFRVPWTARSKLFNPKGNQP